MKILWIFGVGGGGGDITRLRMNKKESTPLVLMRGSRNFRQGGGSRSV